MREERDEEIRAGGPEGGGWLEVGRLEGSEGEQEECVRTGESSLGLKPCPAQ